MSWLDSLRSTLGGTAARRGRAARHLQDRVLKLEALEDRTLLTTYTVIELQTQMGRRSYGYGISDDGITTGESMLMGVRHLKASEWDIAGNRTWTGVIGGNKFSVGRSMNDSEITAGSTNITPTPTLWRAFKTDGAGNMIDLGILSGSTGNSYGEGINDSGTVVGYGNYSGSPSDKYHATLYGVTNTDIHPGWGGDSSIAYDINNSGVIVGSSNATTFMQYPRPFVRDSGGTYTELPLIPGYAHGGEAFAVNNTGKVVGGTYFVGGVNQTKIWHGFYWDGTTQTDLGNLGLGGDWSQARDVNDIGTVVGIANTTFGDSERHAWIWTGSGAIQDLNGMLTNGAGWVLNSAEGINEDGWIVGYGTKNSLPRGFLLIPDQSPAPGAGISMDPVTAQDIIADSRISTNAIVSAPLSIERVIQRVASTSSSAENVNANETRTTVSTAHNIMVLPGPSAFPDGLTLEMDPLS